MGQGAGGERLAGAGRAGKQQRHAAAITDRLVEAPVLERFEITRVLGDELEQADLVVIREDDAVEGLGRLEQARERVQAVVLAALAQQHRDEAAGQAQLEAEEGVVIAATAADEQQVVEKEAAGQREGLAAREAVFEGGAEDRQRGVDIERGAIGAAFGAADERVERAVDRGGERQEQDVALEVVEAEGELELMQRGRGRGEREAGQVLGRLFGELGGQRVDVDLGFAHGKNWVFHRETLAFAFVDPQARLEAHEVQRFAEEVEVVLVAGRVAHRNRCSPSR